MSTDDDRPLTEDELRDVYGDLAVEHSKRFRRVANGYAHAVALAYDRDIAAAAADDDETVAARVRRWELSAGLRPRDWRTIGVAERDDVDVSGDRESEPIEVTLLLIVEQLRAVGDLVQAFVDADPADTSPDERAQLRRLSGLLYDAQTLFD